MRKLHILLLMSGSLLCGMSYAQEVPSAFVNPPKESRPLVWWHWIDGNISKDGIKADLEWMHRSGIAGFLWKAPYKLEYVAPLKPGKHSLTVKVVNLWANRLVGDAQPGAEKHTYTVIPFYGPDSPLIPSGLIGPVKLCKYE